MKKSVYILIALLSIISSGIQAKHTKKLIEPDKTVLLYPKGQDIDEGISEKGKMITLGPGESNGYDNEESINASGHIYKTGNEARMDMYFPKKPNGQMVVVCPGGGYSFVSSFNEGTMVAEWFTKRGIAVCVVKYRLPNKHYNIPLTDVQNAFRYCRAHAGEWRVKQIGIIGFSAGGHLAASASTMFTDEITRPDFSILIYPVITSEEKHTHSGSFKNLIGSKQDWAKPEMSYEEYITKEATYNKILEKFSVENQVKENTPATFIASCEDDKTVPAHNSITYYNSLITNNIPSELHIYPKGGHGWGFTTPEWGNDRLGIYRQSLMQSLGHWLENIRK